MANNPLTQLVASGQSPWIDFIRRSFMTDGSFGKLISDGEIVGATSNPTIFEKAIDGSNDYDDQLQALVAQGVVDPKKIFDELAIQDIQMAADLLRPVYDRTDGLDGYISLEVSPGSANNTQDAITEARYLWGRVQRPNIMIKIPGTQEGIPAVQQLLTDGINVNITLLFAVDRYEQVALAYVAALEKRLAAGLPINRIGSVASFFVSRVDTEIDKQLETLATNAGTSAEQDRIRALAGKAAIANAKLAYEQYRAIFSGDRFAVLREQGARVQRCLWASTSTKNPHYRDVLYVEELIGPETVDTMPPATIDAFRDHGVVRQSLTQDVPQAHEDLRQLEALGISIATVTHDLEIAGVKSFADSYDQLLEGTAKKVEELRAQASSQGVPHPPGPNSQAGATTGATSESSPSAFAGEVEVALRQLANDGIGERIWNREFALWTSDRDIGSSIVDRLGWLDIARVMETVLREIEDFANEIRTEGFSHLVLLGMGGSSLTAEVLRDTFGKRSGYPDLFVLDSTDPAAIARLELQIDLPHTLFIVASKSGTTIETLSQFSYFFDRMRATKNEEAAGGNFIAISDPGTPLEALASRYAFRAVFRNPPDIGGRFAALSYFGLVPGALMGIDVGALLDSALAMTRACGADQPANQNPGLILGATMGVAAQLGKDKVTIVASPALAAIGSWIEQLIAESTGKEGRGLVPVANEPLGSPNVYGTDRLFVYLRLEDGVDPNQDASLAALGAAGHPVVQIDLRNRYALGGEFYRWEMATALAGYSLKINPFDEPNVRESKDNTKRLLSDYRQEGHLPMLPVAFTVEGLNVTTPVTLADRLRAATSLEQLRHDLLTLGQPGDYIAIMAYLEPTQANDDALQRWRADLRDTSHLATLLSYGPRFLHSTGQLYKGGANRGIFIQLVAADPRDVRIPGEAYSFGTLIHAQSLGDYQALLAHDRRVVRIDLGGDVAGGLAKLARR